MEFTRFLRDLDAALTDLPPEEAARIRDFYSELYYDAVENGKSEEEAVAALGDVGDIRDKTLAELESAGTASVAPNPGGAAPDLPPVRADRPQKSKAGRVLFWCFFPFLLLIGVPLAISAAALWLTVWAILAALWVTAAALAIAFLLGGVSSVYLMTSALPAGLFQLATALFAGGAGILLGVASLVLCRLFARASAVMFRGLASRFRKPRPAKSGQITDTLPPERIG